MRKIDKDRSQGKSEEKRGNFFLKSVYSYKYNNRDFRSRKGISWMVYTDTFIQLEEMNHFLRVLPKLIQEELEN